MYRDALYANGGAGWMNSRSSLMSRVPGACDPDRRTGRGHPVIEGSTFAAVLRCPGGPDPGDAFLQTRGRLLSVFVVVVFGCAIRQKITTRRVKRAAEPVPTGPVPPV